MGSIGNHINNSLKNHLNQASGISQRKRCEISLTTRTSQLDLLHPTVRHGCTEVNRLHGCRNPPGMIHLVKLRSRPVTAW